MPIPRFKLKYCFEDNERNAMDSDRSDSSISAVSSNSELSPNLLTFPTTMDLNYGDFPIKQKQKFIKNVDEIFDLTSQYGWYQFFVLLTIQYAMVNAAGNYVFISFASLSPICYDERSSQVSCLKN